MRFPRVLITAIAVLATGAATLSVALSGAVDTAGAVSTTVPATGIRIGDHPAYVRAVVDFTGRTIGANPQIFATDAQPLDGRAQLQYVIAPGVRTTAAPRSADGLNVRVAKNQRGLRIDLRAAPRTFKYLSYAWVPGSRLAIDLWKAVPPSKAATILRGAHGYLTLDSVSVSTNDLNVVKVAAREQGAFEHQFGVVLRAADGSVLVHRTIHAHGGRWSTMISAASPRRQPATIEAAILSPGDGALTCLVQRPVTLRFTGPAPLHLVHRAHADLDGDGRADLITLGRASAGHGVITATLATGRRISVTTSTVAVTLPGLATVGNVDGRPGDELFVDSEHISTNEFIGVYTYWKGQLRLARTLPGYSAHPGLWAGMTCSARGSRHFITVHQFVEQRRNWTRQDTEYVWRGPSLALSATHPSQRISGLPPPALVGLHCGHIPAP